MIAQVWFVPAMLLVVVLARAVGERIRVPFTILLIVAGLLYAILPGAFAGAGARRPGRSRCVLLTACSDVSPAGWIVASALPWQQLVEFGPSGFAAYARLRYLPDPPYQGQRENEADVEGTWWEGRDQLAPLLQVLASHTPRLSIRACGSINKARIYRNKNRNRVASAPPRANAEPAS